VLPRPRTLVVTDENVARLHLPALMESLETFDIEAGTLVLPAGEATKSFARLQEVADAILDAELERSDLIVAFGGGVIGDLAGFAAAVTRRGMGFVQIPTTLLAQVDSSVGGKTGINCAHAMRTSSAGWRRTGRRCSMATWRRGRRPSPTAAA